MSWDDTVKEWLIDTGYCFAGALASSEDGSAWAAASVNNDAWNIFSCEDHEEEFEQEDGTKKNQTINDATTLCDAVANQTAPVGVWIGGEKYKLVVSRPQFEYHDVAYDVLMLAKPKGGACVCKTPNGTVVIGLFSEDLEQRNSSCQECTLAFAEFLYGEGY